MGWATSGNVVTTNLDSGTDSPALARADIKTAFDELKNVIDGRATSNGVASLDSNSLVPATQIPDELNSSSGNNLTLDPSTDKVVLEHILKLNPQTVAQLNARTDITQGDIAFCSNGDAGTECLAVAVIEDDSAGNPTWKVVSIGNAIATS
jgi:hypothetical protein|tara:strand:+ start:1982 stop:2434 length:453 start_codon:yes stop_codon:yes gene_type:complete